MQVDGKVRSGMKGNEPLTEPLIVGWDAAGVVEAVGSEVTLFKPGDEVYFAGVINRPGKKPRKIRIPIIPLNDFLNLALCDLI